MRPFDIERARHEYERISSKPIRINKSTFKIIGKIPFIGWHFFFVLSRAPKVKTLGMANLCLDGKFVLFLDYDNCSLYRVRQEVLMLQREFNLGTLAILTTGISFTDDLVEYGNYHVVGVMKFNSLEECKGVVGLTSCDDNFKRIDQFFHNKYWVLRIFPKYSANWEKLRERPILREILHAKSNREISSSHYNFMKIYYGFPELTGRKDGSSWIRIIEYQTTEGKWSSDILPKTASFLKMQVNRFVRWVNYGDREICTKKRKGI